MQISLLYLLNQPQCNIFFLFIEFDSIIADSSQLFSKVDGYPKRTNLHHIISPPPLRHSGYVSVHCKFTRSYNITPYLWLNDDL